MTINFSSNNFENPSIQKFYAGLQAFALNEKKPEEIEDTLEPDYEGMEKMGKVIQKMKQTFFNGDQEDPVAKMKEPKAKAGSKRGQDQVESISDGVQNINIEEEEKKENRGKRVKVEERKEEKDWEVSNKQLKTMLSKGLMEKESVQWLKDVLDERGVQTKA